MAGVMFAIPATAPAATPALNRDETAGIPEGIPAEYLFYHRGVVPQVLMFSRPPEGPSRCYATGWPGFRSHLAPLPPARIAPAAPGPKPDSGESR